MDTKKEDVVRVSVFRDNLLEVPDLWLGVYIAGDASEQRAFADMFTRARCYKVKNIESADLVVFTGGPDVNPILYDEDVHPSTHFDNERDRADIGIYNYCLNEGIPMFGVCRGAQFLAVMNGGKLYQDVDNHVGHHPIYLIDERRVLKKCSSVHHQMVIKNNNMVVLADASVARTRWKNSTDSHHGMKMDVEAYFIRETCCLGVQGHPEYSGYDEYMVWCLKQIKEYIVDSPDTAMINHVTRLKPEFLAERDARWGDINIEFDSELLLVEEIN